MKKLIGLVVIGLIVAGLLYLVYKLFFSERPIRSPLPEDAGIKVIFVTPEKNKED